MKNAGVCHDIFSEQALNTIYELTEGVPRVINNICSAAFAEAAVEQAQIIDVDHVRSANKNINFNIRDIQK